MPYINGFDRTRLEHLVKTMHLTEVDNAGQLNYLVTQLVHTFLGQHQEGYQNFNDALGALEGAKLELYRRYIAQYEDHKIQINGDVP